MIGAALRRFFQKFSRTEDKQRECERKIEADRIAKGLHDAAGRVHFLEISAELMRRKVQNEHTDVETEATPE
jgi:hypothetical protein